ncbi:MAG: (E)-4-hydroxy-3-methylbut-2-enyl-diphosphate synthase [Bacteroidota bacterium]|nr:(E)-4-hydroxy-3-methylbut-2-enyl-diphosphate synthase [Bacteroidota bacterium]
MENSLNNQGSKSESGEAFQYKRFITREVNIGGIPLGGINPVRIQTMTNTPTIDTAATVEQTIRCVRAGAEYVRITVPTIKEAENLFNIKAALRKQGYTVPLVADVHFNPAVAEVAARLVEKVRINPGNYIDKKQVHKFEFTDSEYALELEKIHERLLPLLAICKQYGTVLRIGVNHGSLSDRIMSRYGDTPAGMVESAMEFLKICRAEGFNDLVVSMKSSNTRVMVQAYRLLVEVMQGEGMNYPLHLGVTEAGEGEDGRIKAAVGTGTLLAEGIGDTIRVSLTEDPEKELPVAQKLSAYFSIPGHFSIENHGLPVVYKRCEYSKRISRAAGIIGGSNLPVVVADYKENQGFSLEEKSSSAEFYYFSQLADGQKLPADQNFIFDYALWDGQYRSFGNVFPLMTISDYFFGNGRSETMNFLLLENKQLTQDLLTLLSTDSTLVLVLQSFSQDAPLEMKAFFNFLIKNDCHLPVILNRNYCEDDLEQLEVKSGSDFGSLFIDGLGDGLWLRNASALGEKPLEDLSFAILQASRVRSTKAEYISCPSCGRTHFDLQTATAKIRERTSHLKHLKIGIMGCIVNGPGEMADADYGYVGAGLGKINLYKGKEVMKKNIPEADAVDELIALIKANGDWQPA